MALSDEQRTEVQDIADLKCRIHMKELFERSLPRIIEAAFSAHNEDIGAHAAQIATHAAACPLARKFDRVLWLIIGLAFGSGVAGGSVLVRFLLAL